jgi:hypothetical protein
MRIQLIAIAVISGAWLAAQPARAAIELTPGTWQDTETGEENGKPVPPQVTTDCMTPEEAKDPVKILTAMKDQAGECGKLDIKQSGNVVTFIMQCGEPEQLAMDMQATYTFIDARHYTGVLTSTVILAGKKTTANKYVNSVWVGVCKKESKK